MLRGSIEGDRGRRLGIVIVSVVLLSTLMPASAGATVTTPIPSAPPVLPPPISEMPAAGDQAPPAALIGDPITPEATCGGWAVQSAYGGAWPTDQSWWEFACTHAMGPCVGSGACNADQHSNDHWTYVDHFAFDGATAVFYGESFDSYYFDDWTQEGSQCFLWWDQGTTQWYVAPDPLCPYAPAGSPPPANERPIADPRAQCDGLDCSFDGSSSSDRDGWVAGFAWAFGDGSTSGSSGTSHRYAGPGTYAVTLTVTDDGGATATDAVTLTVQNRQPLAVVALDCTGLDCRYDGNGSRDPDGTVAGYRWMFGDGSADTSRGGVHRYAAVGAYSLTLEVTDNAGGLATTASTVALIGLQALVPKSRGATTVMLSWTGAAGATFSVFRNGTQLASVAATSFSDELGRGARGTFVYQICQAGAPVCSAGVPVTL